MWEYCAEETKYENIDLCWGRRGESRDHGPKLSWQPPVRFNNLSQYNLNIPAGSLTGNNWLDWLLRPLLLFLYKYSNVVLIVVSSLMTTWYNLSLLSAGANFIKTSLPTCPHSTEWLLWLECSAGRIGGEGGILLGGWRILFLGRERDLTSDYNKLETSSPLVNDHLF